MKKKPRLKPHFFVMNKKFLIAFFADPPELRKKPDRARAAVYYRARGNGEMLRL
jgi:hypothetical protein